ncbi:GntR family transcriptional regulator [Microbacterium sp. 4R-513]|uniref:GntR family transcriptional regulator n=1 Tax=Microbacterium sp. 4R-513 TaxID=2567934 RepID=UPI0013E19189|nr:GntR family transcriptional regulator [Microbacterium sp. 4R-513]QIG39429.1 GntR family transcriptional regulator [Microbacterium sp. 4R-513]
MTALDNAAEAGGRVRGRFRGSKLDSLEPSRGAPGYSADSRGRISDYVYEELGEAIRSLRLHPGATLSEPAVAAWLKVSRAPVREAFTRLADQRLITIVPQVGSKVAPISMRDVSDAVFVRSSLETGAFRQTIAAQDLDVTQLQAMVDRNREALERGDAEEFFDTDEQLHQLVFALAGVPHLWELVRGMKVHLDRLRRMSLSAAIHNAELPLEHQRIVDAIVDRDEAAGTAVIHLHSHRVLADTTSLQAEYPDYFAS